MLAEYNDSFDPEIQVEAEEAIASMLFEYTQQLSGKPSEEDCTELGKKVLLNVLQWFRPDLFEGQTETAAEDEEDTDLSYRCLVCHAYLFFPSDEYTKDEVFAQLQQHMKEHGNLKKEYTVSNHFVRIIV